MPYEAPPRVSLETSTRRLRCVMTVDEAHAKAQELVRALGELEAMRERHAGEKRAMASAERDLDGSIRLVAVDVREGKLSRDVECEKIADFEAKKIVVVRLDTDEVLEERPLDDYTRQLALKLSGAVAEPTEGQPSLPLETPEPTTDPDPDPGEVQNEADAAAAGNLPPEPAAPKRKRVRRRPSLLCAWLRGPRMLRRRRAFADPSWWALLVGAA